MANIANKRNALPIATIALIITNVMAFLVQLISYNCFDSHEWWWVNLMNPAQVVGAFEQSAPGQLLFAGWSVLVSMFLHGSMASIVGNMLVLWCIGLFVERRLGWRVFISAYLLTGYAAMMPFVLNTPKSEIPCLGAGGAVAGIHGVFFVLLLTREVLPNIRLWKKLLLCGLTLGWLGEQIYGIYQGANGIPQNIAYWGEAGGFVAGVLLAVVVALTLALASKDPATAPSPA